MKRGLKKPVKVGPDRTGLDCDVVERLHLSQDLGLPQNHRIQGACDAKDVPHRLLLRVAIELLPQLFAVDAALLTKERLHGFQALGAVLHARQKLDTVAGGKDHRFLNAGTLHELAQRLRQLLRMKRRPLARVQLRGLVVQSDQGQIQSHSYRYV